MPRHQKEKYHVGSHRINPTARPDVLKALRRGRHRASTALRTSIRNGSAFGLAAVMVGAGLVVAPQTAVAAEPESFTPGSFSTVVPPGACYVTATVAGGGGANYMIDDPIVPAGDNLRGGGGAEVTATFPVTPGQTMTGIVGAGGTQDSGGTPGGGAPGEAVVTHGGGGGGGYSELKIDDISLIVAGGGGGTGGGHWLKYYWDYPPANLGAGGDAGLPVTAGIAAGSNGGPGADGKQRSFREIGFGHGGGTTAPGLGGSKDPDGGYEGELVAEDGQPGAGRVGGRGGNDASRDAGGGGGGGWFGGGGGPSTYNVSVAGGGGGGGSSYVAAGALGIDSKVGERALGGAENEDLAQPGAHGFVTLTWDTASCASATDDAKLDQPHGAVTVDVRANDDGELKAGTVRLLNGTSPVTSLVVPNEGTWTVSGNNVVFTPLTTFLGNPTPQNYQWTTTGNTVVSAKVTVGYKPFAADDKDLDNAMGSTVTISSPTSNDIGGAVPSKTRLLNGSAPVTSLPVTGEGTWSVNTSTGAISFVPVDGFTGDPTPVPYRMTDEYGKTADANVTVTYLPAAFDDVDAGNETGEPVTVTPTDNDHDEIDPESTRLLDPTGDPVTELVVPGEGTWTVDPATGKVTFDPVDELVGNPTPVEYQVLKPGTSDPLTATITVAYVPEAVDDEKLLQPLGEPVTVDTIGNDIGDLDLTTFRIVGSSGPGADLVVPGEGTWSVDPATGEVTFTPLATFTGNPSPINYTVDDEWGYPTGATVTVTYRVEALDDVSAGNDPGDPVTVPVTDNDHDELVPESTRLIDPTGNPVMELVVPGEGTWTVAPGADEITFEPETEFTGNPTPVKYQVEDPTGVPVEATVTVAYTPQAGPDEDLLNPLGESVTVDPLVNDTDRDDLDPASVRVWNGTDWVTTYVVPSEGTWTVDPATGEVTFEPLPALTTDPTPVTYQVADVWGETAESTITVTYRPDARDDEDLDNVLGTTVVVDAIGNDHDSLLPTTMRLLDAGGDPVTELVVMGEGTWTVDAAGQVTFVPEPGFLVDPAPVGYQVEDAAGTVVTATVTVTYLPTVVADASLGNPSGTAVTVPVLTNDTGEFIVNSVRLVNPAGDPVTTLVVPGEGTWSVAGNTGAVTFTPLSSFPGNPTPVSYRVTDVTGDTVETTVTITYQVSVVDVVKGGNEPGDPVTVPVPVHPEIDPGTLKIIDPVTGDPVTTVTVPGEGVWTVDPGTGEVTFVPEPGFTGDPTPIEYQLEDPATGDPLIATITVLYGPLADDDESTGNPFGQPVDVPVLDNDEGLLDPGTVRILTPGTGTPVTELVVPGEGVWTVDPTTGVISFTPEPGFTGDPTPITYQVTDDDGEETTATVTVGYQPDARDDVSTGNPTGKPVAVDVTGNDHDDVDPTTVRLIDENGDPVTRLVVPGEGVWTVDTVTGVVTFTPEKGFEGDPTPVRYTALDSDGFEVTATITVTYAAPFLPITGATVLPIALLALLLLGVGATGILTPRLRRK